LLNNIDLNNLILNGAAAVSGSKPEQTIKLDQNVHIEANFPNVSSSAEIEKAFENLVN